mmetsp:Transcript_5866/g.14275  ORF Transcript_5866/g.14275 Transcript_5866/m.14275 type:complete len:87 (-) Transcript_5866:523-783(-)
MTHEARNSRRRRREAVLKRPTPYQAQTALSVSTFAGLGAASTDEAASAKVDALVKVEALAGGGALLATTTSVPDTPAASASSPSML